MFNLEDAEKAVRLLVLPYLKHNHPNSELLNSTADEIVNTTANFGMLESSTKSGTPIYLFWTNALQLVLADRTNEEWLTTYHECRRWAHDYQLSQKQNGTPLKIVERLFVFLHFGYLTEIKDISNESAVKHTAELFRIPIERIELWTGKKHRYSEERGPVDEFIEIAKIFRNGSEEEIATFFKEKIPSLFEK